MQSTAACLNNKIQRRISNIFTAIVAGVPILATYASGIPGFSVADAALIICVCLTILAGFPKPINTFVVRPILIYIAMYLIVVFSMISLIIQPSPQYVNVTIRITRYFFYLIATGICGRRILNIKKCRQIVKNITFAATVYIFIQYGLYHLLGVVLKGFVPFLDVYVEGYMTTDYAYIYATQMYRPTSFFLEPAHYARYAIIGIAILLFDKEQPSLKKVTMAVFVSVGILISTSAQGYMLLALVWLTWIIKQLNDTRNSNLKNILACILPFTPILLGCIFSLPFVQNTVFRALSGDLQDTNTALGARLGGVYYYLQLPFIHKILGMGFGCVPRHSWLSSAVYWLYGSGIIVFILYVIYGIICILKTQKSQRIILLVFLILFATDDSFYSSVCVLFISLSLLQPNIPDNI